MMRVLFSITKQSPFFLSLDIPKSEDLGFVSERYPVVNELFRRLYTHYKVERLKIVAESSVYLGQHKSLRRRRIVRSVALEMSNRFTTGGGTSVTGFTINGINCSARLAEGCVEVTSYEDHAEKSSLFVLKIRSGQRQSDDRMAEGLFHLWLHGGVAWFSLGFKRSICLGFLGVLIFGFTEPAHDFGSQLKASDESGTAACVVMR